MSDINLLPEDKRLAEDKERNRKKSKAGGIELTNPKRESDGKGHDKKSLSVRLGEFFKKMKKTEYLKPKTIQVDKPVTESYGDALSRERKKYPAKSAPRKEVPLPEVKVIEQQKPKIGFWQKMKLEREEKQRKKQMMVGKKPKMINEVKEVKKDEEKPKKDIKVSKKVFSGMFSSHKNKKPKKIKHLPEIKMPEAKPKAEPEIRLKKKTVKKETKKFGLSAPKPEEGEEGLEVNLMPQKIEISEITVSKFLIILLNTALITVIVAGLIYLGFHWYLGGVKDKINGYNQEIVTTQKEISSLKAKTKEALSLQKRMVLAKDMLSDHIHWSNFFSYLEEKTIDDVYFLDMQGEKEGRIVLTGTAESFMAVGKQLYVFQNDKVMVRRASVDIAQIQKSDIGADEKSVFFNLYLYLKPDIFLTK